MKNLEQWNFDHHLYFCYHLPSDIHLSKLVKEGSDFGASIKLQMHHTKCKYVHTSPHQAMKDLNLTQNMEYIKKV